MTGAAGAGEPPLELPEGLLERVRALCLALPEVTVRTDEPLVPQRSTAYSFDIRRRSFCLLMARLDGRGRTAALLVLRARRHERAALLAAGYPFRGSRAGPDRITVALDDGTDWAEIGELVTESYRILAPKKLTALLG